MVTVTAIKTETPAEKARRREVRRKAIGRPIGFSKLVELLANDGFTIRRGTTLRSAFPEGVWQLFNDRGELLHLIRWSAVQKWVSRNGKGRVSDEPGENL